MIDRIKAIRHEIKVLETEVILRSFDTIWACSESERNLADTKVIIAKKRIQDLYKEMDKILGL